MPERGLLSGQQRRSWRLGAWNGGSPWRAAGIVELRGPLSRDLLRRAIARVVTRHEILRTAFLAGDAREEACAVVVDPAPWIEERDPDAPPASARELLERGVAARLDPAAGRVCRFEISAGANGLLLGITLSALCGDRSTLATLAAEIADACRALAAGGAPGTEAIQYEDVAASLRRLAPFSTGPAPIGSPELRPASLPVRVERRAIERLLAAPCERPGALRSAVLAAWQATLARHGRPAAVIHVAFDGRRHEALRAALGPLTRMLPVPVPPQHTAPLPVQARAFDEALERVAARQETAPWQETPVEAGFEWWTTARIAAGDLELRIVATEACLEPFVVALLGTEADGDLELSLRYDPGQVDPQEASLLAETLSALLASEPETSDVARADERPGAEERGLGPFRPIHERIAERARIHPEAVAISFAGRSLRYGDLGRRVSHLASRLRRRGAGRGGLVAICCPRSPEVIVAALATLEAGAAYVPLDPAVPRERLAFLLEDAGAGWVVTPGAFAASLPAGSFEVVRLDPDEPDPDASDGPPPGVAVAPEDLAYVIYTSGSTGRPKGVMVTHEGLDASNQARIACYPDPVPSFLLLSSFAFDSSVAGVYWTLVQGGTIHLVDEDAQRDVTGLAELVRRHRITHTLALPSFYDLLLEHARPGELDSLRLVIVAGEPCPLALVERHRERLGDTPLFSEYGATETTVFSSIYDCLGQTSPVAHLGREIPGARMYVLDEELAPATPGVAGEVYFGGVGIARGYWRRPDLTAERFLPDPFSGVAGSRLYRSGDRARRRDDGEIEFLGRVDHQIKIRGFRVELEEIEAVLALHPDVREAVVTLRQGASTSLVATVAPRRSSVDLDDLRAFLARTLPDYMIPSVFVTTPELPRTPNGKVDRRALPEPPAASAETFVAPRTRTERLLAQWWQELLEVDRVGTGDDFFELGGDSIIAMQIVARARRERLSLTVTDVFRNPTIAALAAAARTGRTPAAEPDVPTGTVPLTPIQRWFFERRPPEPDHANLSMLLELGERVAPERIEAALQAIVDHHHALRLRFARGPRGWRQRGSPPETIPPLVRENLSGLTEPERGRRIEEVASRLQTSLDLGRGPLLRAAWFDAGPGRNDLLALVIHHLVFDGVSWRILFEDLETALEQLEHGSEVALPDETTSFRSWARRLARHARSGAAHDELAFWLAGPGAHEAAIPLDFDVRPDTNLVRSQRTITTALDVEETRALLHDLPRRHRARIDAVLLTALLEALAPWTGRRSLWIDLESHGRADLFDDVDTSRTAGWFTAAYPAFLDLGNACEPGEALARVEGQLARIPRNGIGYGLLRYGANRPAARALRRRPQPLVNFNNLGRFDSHGSGRLRIARRSVGPDASPDQPRPHLLEVVTIVSNGRLEIDWSYGETAHHRTTVEALAGRFDQALRRLLNEPRARALDPAGLAEFAWTADDLRDIETAIAQTRSDS